MDPMNMKTIDGDEAPYIWLQQPVTVVTAAEEITGRLMVVGGSRPNPTYLLVHDESPVDAPVYIPMHSVCSITPEKLVPEGAEIVEEEEDEELNFS